MSEITISLRGRSCYIVRDQSQKVLGSILKNFRDKKWDFYQGTNKPNADQLTQIMNNVRKLNS